MLRLLFHAPGKTSLKMSKIIREICVQVREKNQGTFFHIFGGNPVTYIAALNSLVQPHTTPPHPSLREAVFTYIAASV